MDPAPGRYGAAGAKVMPFDGVLISVVNGPLPAPQAENDGQTLGQQGQVGQPAERRQVSLLAGLRSYAELLLCQE
jgi:hypothetical protein